MRILMISDVYFPRINGVSTSLKTFIADLQKLGHNITLVCPNYGNNDDDPTHIIRIPAKIVLFDPEDRFMSYGSILKLRPILKRQKFDLIHIHTPFVAHYAGIKLGKQLNIPVIETYHTYFEDYLHHYIPLLPKLMTKKLASCFTRSQCNAVQQVIVPSGPIHQALSDYGVNTAMTILPTGLPDNHFQAGNGQDFRQKHNIDNNTPLLLTVSRIAFEKNIGFLLQVMQNILQQLPEARMIIAGEGPASSHYQKMAHKLNIKHAILFLGYLDRETELRDCYSAADTFVFASKTETQGLVLLEAMAVGCPIVSTAMMGTKDVLTNQQGCLIAENNLDDFVAKTITILKDQTINQQLRETAVTYAQQWSGKVFAEKLQELYKSCLKKHTVKLKSVLGSSYHE